MRKRSGRYPFHWHLLGFSADAESIVVEAGDASVVLEPAEAWHLRDLTTLDVDQRFWLGGSDHLYYQSCERRHCTESASLSASFTFDAPAGDGFEGIYDLLISQPVNVYSVTALEYWNGVSLSPNVTCTVMQGSTLIAEFEFSQKANDPVDVMKQWNLLASDLDLGALGVDSSADEPLSVTLHKVDTCGGRCAIAVDALQLRHSPKGRNYLIDSSVHDSFYRCASIHGTNDVVLSQNVAHNVRGHCYYLEDGVEERNTIEYNLASFIHPIGLVAAGQ